MSELPLLIDRYKKEIWEWKQKESQWIKDQNQLEGSKRIIEELSDKIIQLEKEKNRLPYLKCLAFNCDFKFCFFI